MIAKHKSTCFLFCICVLRSCIFKTKSCRLCGRIFKEIEENDVLKQATRYVVDLIGLLKESDNDGDIPLLAGEVASIINPSTVDQMQTEGLVDFDDLKTDFEAKLTHQPSIVKLDGDSSSPSNICIILSSDSESSIPVQHLVDATRCHNSSDANAADLNLIDLTVITQVSFQVQSDNGIINKAPSSEPNDQIKATSTAFEDQQTANSLENVDNNKIAVQNQSNNHVPNDTTKLNENAERRTTRQTGRTIQATTDSKPQIQSKVAL
jgi:hypothetical protein